MPAFPPLAVFKQAKAALGADSMKLSALNRDYQRFADTYIYDYVKLVRDDKRPFAVLTDGHDRQRRIAIIGAGFSGLCAAYELLRAGAQQITVYEAEPKRLGGRAETSEFHDEQGRVYYNELGPMRFPQYAKLFWHYLREMDESPDDPVIPKFPNPGVVATEMFFQGQTFSWQGPDGPDDRPGFEWSEIRRGWKKLMDQLTVDCDGETVDVGVVGALLKKDWDQGHMPLDAKKKVHCFWEAMVKRYQGRSFKNVLVEILGDEWNEQYFRMFSTLGLGTGGFGPIFPISFVEIIRLLIWDYADEYAPHITLTQFIDMFAARIQRLADAQKAHVDFKYHTVCYLGYDKSDDPVVVSIKANDLQMNQLEMKAYDYVIVTVPLRSAQIRMQADATVVPISYRDYVAKSAFPDDGQRDVRDAIRIPNMMDASKLFGFVREKPWVPGSGINWPKVDGQPVKCVLTDTLPRQMYFLDPYPQRDDAGLNVLISYNWGADSIRNQGIMNYMPWHDIYGNACPDFNLKMAYQLAISSTTENNPVAQVLDSITVEDTRHPENPVLSSVFWQQKPLIFGAFKLDFPGQYYYGAQVAFQYQEVKDDRPCNRIILAGNNVAFIGGWVEGAFMSAVNAVAAVLYHITKEPGGGHRAEFRMDDLFRPNPFDGIIERPAPDDY